MSLDIFVINDGKAIITPSNLADQYTLTLKLGNEYRKLRQIKIERASEIIKRGDTLEDWYQIGSEDSKICLNKKDIDNEIVSIKDSELKMKVHDAFHEYLKTAHVESFLDPAPSQKTSKTRTPTLSSIPMSYIFRGAPWIKEEILATRAGRVKAIRDLRKYLYKITCIMTPEGELQAVATKKLIDGKVKWIKAMRSLWENATVPECEFGPVAILAKPKKGVQKQIFEINAQLSSYLIATGIPHVLRIRQIKRNDPEKAGLMMEWCRKGDLLSFIYPHFDKNKETVLPQYRKQHLSLLLQVAEFLCAMKSHSLSYDDVKLTNILIQYTPQGNVEIYIADLEGIKPFDVLSKQIPGTYPPPEFLETFKQQIGDVFAQLPLEEKAEYDSLSQKGKNEGWTPVELKEREELFLQAFIKGICITPEIDAWAFGILIWMNMHYLSETIMGLCYQNPPSKINEMRDLILHSHLNPEDPADQIIADLLSKKQEERITIEQARENLQKALVACRL